MNIVCLLVIPSLYPRWKLTTRKKQGSLHWKYFEGEPTGPDCARRVQLAYCTGFFSFPLFPPSSTFWHFSSPSKPIHFLLLLYLFSSSTAFMRTDRWTERSIQNSNLKSLHFQINLPFRGLFWCCSKVPGFSQINIPSIPRVHSLNWGRVTGWFWQSSDRRFLLMGEEILLQRHGIHFTGSWKYITYWGAGGHWEAHIENWK